jgi:hypothetical protein
MAQMVEHHTQGPGFNPQYHQKKNFMENIAQVLKVDLIDNS